MTTMQFVAANEFRDLEREHDKLKAEHERVVRAAREVQIKAYEEGREAARREYMRTGSNIGQGDGLAQLSLPDNGGAIQFHVIGPSPMRPLTGGLTTPDADFLLRIWGPPDEAASYGVHEQGGGNLTDFSMAFDLTPAGMVIHRMDIQGVRTKWDRS